MKKKIIAVLCAAAMAASSGMPAYAKAKTTYITPSSFTVNVNAKRTISLKNNKKAVKWSSSTKNVALSKKSKKGVTVTGKKTGSAVVIAKIGKKSYKAKVKVAKASSKSKTKKVKKGLSVTKKAMKVGESFTLRMNGAKVSSWDADHRLKLTKKTKTSVKVTAVKANKAGKTSTVYAYAGGKTYTCDISIADKNHEWVPVYKTVHHAEVSHNETKTVTEPFVLETNGDIVHNEFLDLCYNHPDQINYNIVVKDQPWYGQIKSANGIYRPLSYQEFMADLDSYTALDYGYVSDGQGGYRARTAEEFYEAKKTDSSLQAKYEKWCNSGAPSWTDAQSVRSGYGSMFDSDGNEVPGWHAGGGVNSYMTNLYKRTFVHHLTRTVTKTEKVVDRAAYDEKVIDHYVCKTCDATKKA